MSRKQSESETKTVANPHSSPDPIKSRFLSDGNAAMAVSARSAMVDDLVCHAYQSSLAVAMPKGVAVLAVGGFGRSELFPQSDVDVLLLVEKDIEGNAVREALSAFLRSLWDSGLRLSQSVRTIAECCELDQKNVELSVSLLDQRFLTGDQAHYAQLSARLPKFFRSQRNRLISSLCEMTRARHAKFRMQVQVILDGHFQRLNHAIVTQQYHIKFADGAAPCFYDQAARCRAHIGPCRLPEQHEFFEGMTEWRVDQRIAKRRLKRTGLAISRLQPVGATRQFLR